MAWEHLSINKPHLVYIILGGFTSLFMLCSSIIKERLYIGEATVATLCGIIFGPHAANLINPDSWGNEDQITLEFSRIVLVVQCFAVGVELPKAYMERHWKSVVFLLVPVMTFGWLITSLFIWAVFSSQLNWLDSLVCAACVTATDPVLASSVVGKGKFAKRVPKHLRDLLSAESGCNDGMAFPFIYLGIYLVRYRPDANEVSLHWFCFTILYECIFGAFYGVVVGYLARRAIRFAHERDLIDRESFLVFYFVLALFCAGSGSLLGMDDLLVGFACGVGFSNDGWFQEKTEETHVSNVIDLLINLAFFVYFGTIIPWNSFAAEVIGTSPWRLVVIAVLVIFFRRIPIMLMLKPVIPDIKTWREALFAGHFGPIGVGALFVAILARAEFETDTTTPLGKLPPPGFEHRNIIELIWPITTFLVITSIIVHGSSIAVFTLGRHINTLTFTMSFTKANDESNWMDRLPRIQSRSKSSMSLQKDDDLEKVDYSSPGIGHPSHALPLPRLMLRRQKEEDTNSSRASSLGPLARRRKWDSGIGPGGHVEDSAISPRPSNQNELSTTPSPEKVDSDSTAFSSDESPVTEHAEDAAVAADRTHQGKPQAEVFSEGDNDVVEDEEGNVLSVVKSPKEETEKGQEECLGKEAISAMSKEDVESGVAQAEHQESGQGPKGRIEQVVKEITNDQSDKPGGMGNMMRKLSTWGESIKSSRATARRESQQQLEASPSGQRKSLPARAFRFGNTVIVEDEDGEVIKKYDLGERSGRSTQSDRQRIHKWIKGSQGGTQEENQTEGEPGDRKKSAAQGASKDEDEDEDDPRMRFNVEGRRLSKAEFFQQIQSLDAQSRPRVIDEADELEQSTQQDRPQAQRNQSVQDRRPSRPGPREGQGEIDVGEVPQRVDAVATQTPKSEDLQRLDSAYGQDIPVHSVSKDLKEHAYMRGQTETAADRRRRLTGQQAPIPEGKPAETAADRRRRLMSEQTSTTKQQPRSGNENTERTSPAGRTRDQVQSSATQRSSAEADRGKAKAAQSEVEETPAERRRRLGALGVSTEDSDSEDESQPRQPPKGAKGGDNGPTASAGPPSTGSSIRFADQAGELRPKFGNIKWGSNRRG